MPHIAHFKEDDKLIFLSDADIPSSPAQSKRFGVGYAHTPGRKTEFVNNLTTPVMEDVLLIKGSFRQRENEDLFCLFDGHDGVTAAKFASLRFETLFAEQLTHFLEEPQQQIPRILFSEVDLHKEKEKELEEKQKWIVLALHTTFKRLQNELRDILVLENKNEFFGGTTALVAYFDDQDLYIANVGDTRAILGKDNGTIERLSVDHHPHLSCERERIEACGGRIHSLLSCPRVEGSLAVSRVLGDFDLEDKGVTWQPFIRVIRNFRESGQFVVMATDGLWELVSEEKVIATVQEELDFSLTASSSSSSSSPVVFRRQLPLFSKGNSTLQSITSSLSTSPSPSTSPTSSVLPSSPVKRRRRKVDVKGDSESALEASTRLVREAFDQFSVDNISVVVVRF